MNLNSLSLHRHCYVLGLPRQHPQQEHPYDDLHSCLLSDGDLRECCGDPRPCTIKILYFRIYTNVNLGVMSIKDFNTICNLLFNISKTFTKTVKRFSNACKLLTLLWTWWMSAKHNFKKSSKRKFDRSFILGARPITLAQETEQRVLFNFLLGQLSIFLFLFQFLQVKKIYEINKFKKIPFHKKYMI